MKRNARCTFPSSISYNWNSYCKRLFSTVLSRQMESEMMFATPLGSGVQPASLAAQFQGRKSSTRFTG